MSKDFETGYGKPPEDFQFKKGQSGNPGGRPPGSKNIKKELEEELLEPISIREGTRTIQVSKQRAVLKSVAAKAVRGDVRAAEALFKMAARYLQIEDADEDEPALSKDELSVLENYKTQILEATEKKKRGKSPKPRSLKKPKRRKS